LTAANDQLQQKVKEALSVQPAAVAPGELAKVQEDNIALQKQRDLLLVDLDQQKAALSALRAPAPPNAATNKLAGELAALKAQSSKDAKTAQAQITDLKSQVQDSANKLAAATADLDKLKSRPSAETATNKLAGELAALKAQSSKDAKTAQAQIADLKSQVQESAKKLAAATADLEKWKSLSPPPPQNVQELISERDKLKKELAEKIRELGDREAHPEAPAATPSQDAVKLQQVEQERDSLQKQLAALSQPAPNSGTGGGAALSSENASLRARLAELEAAAVPYTPEELAVIAASASAPTPVQAPVAGVTLTHKAHSIQDLPPGAGPLIADAQRAFGDGDFAQSEKKLLEVLAQDPDNIYVLFNLGMTQFAQGGSHLDDCEKNVRHALELDPNDAGSLYLLGRLRFLQKRLDEALEALSRSDSINPTNSMTKNFLGCILTEKGLRTNAETAFRKALEIDPLNRDAHFNLAFVYATEKPPAPALANWHYKRAIALGHAKDDSLEKLIAGGP
jgi:Tfp pilus assembly protein PilF